MSKIAILLTSFNRKLNTLACIKSIYNQTNILNNNFSIFLTIDGSTDGTAEAVQKEFKEVNLFFCPRTDNDCKSSSNRILLISYPF